MNTTTYVIQANREVIKGQPWSDCFDQTYTSLSAAKRARARQNHVSIFKHRIVKRVTTEEVVA